LRRWLFGCGVALWSTARVISGAVTGRLPGGRVIERGDRRGESIAEEEPAAPDSSRRELATARELVHRRARDAEQVGHIPRREDVGSLSGPAAGVAIY
jgi:hypothetical protein